MRCNTTSNTSIAHATAGIDDGRSHSIIVLLVHTTQETWPFGPAEKRREHNVKKHQTSEPARNVPLSMSTTSAAARRAITMKFIFLPLLTLPAHLVHLLKHRLRPLLQRLSKLPRLQAFFFSPPPPPSSNAQPGGGTSPCGRPLLRLQCPPAPVRRGEALGQPRNRP